LAYLFLAEEGERGAWPLFTRRQGAKESGIILTVIRALRLQRVSLQVLGHRKGNTEPDVSIPRYKKEEEKGGSKSERGYSIRSNV